MTCTMLEVHCGKGRAGPIVRIRDCTVKLKRQQNVLQGRQFVEQLERLKHKGGVAPAQLGGGGFVEPAGVMAAEQHLPAGGPVETGQQPEQRRFARARHPRDGLGLTAAHEEIDLAEDLQLAAFKCNALADCAGLNDDIRISLGHCEQTG